MTELLLSRFLQRLRAWSGVRVYHATFVLLHVASLLIARSHAAPGRRLVSRARRRFALFPFSSDQSDIAGRERIRPQVAAFSVIVLGDAFARPVQNWKKTQQNIHFVLVRTLDSLTKYLPDLSKNLKFNGVHIP